MISAAIVIWHLKRFIKVQFEKWLGNRISSIIMSKKTLKTLKNLIKNRHAHPWPNLPRLSVGTFCIVKKKSQLIP